MTDRDISKISRITEELSKLKDIRDSLNDRHRFLSKSDGDNTIPIPNELREMFVKATEHAINNLNDRISRIQVTFPD